MNSEWICITWWHRMQSAFSLYVYCTTCTVEKVSWKRNAGEAGPTVVEMHRRNVSPTIYIGKLSWNSVNASICVIPMELDGKTNNIPSSFRSDIISSAWLSVSVWVWVWVWVFVLPSVLSALPVTLTLSMSTSSTSAMKYLLIMWRPLCFCFFLFHSDVTTSW